MSLESETNSRYLSKEQIRCWKRISLLLYRSNGWFESFSTILSMNDSMKNYRQTLILNYSVGAFMEMFTLLLWCFENVPFANNFQAFSAIDNGLKLAWILWKMRICKGKLKRNRGKLVNQIMIIFIPIEQCMKDTANCNEMSCSLPIQSDAKIVYYIVI